jgi:hypothetical protein
MCCNPDGESALVIMNHKTFRDMDFQVFVAAVIPLVVAVIQLVVLSVVFTPSTKGLF